MQSMELIRWTVHAYSSFRALTESLYVCLDLQFQSFNEIKFTCQFIIIITGFKSKHAVLNL